MELRIDIYVTFAMKILPMNDKLTFRAFLCLKMYFW